MTKTKSILIIIFALICVAVGLLSPYFIAGVNKQELKNNQIDITLSEYDDISIGEVYTFSIEKEYSAVYSPRAFFNGEIYIMGTLKCEDNDVAHNGWHACNSSIVLTSLFPYTLKCTNSDGDTILSETKYFKPYFVVNDYDHVNLTIETYNDSNELVSTEIIENLTYTDLLYDDGSINNRTFSYDINLENLDKFTVSLTLTNMDNPNFNGHIHKN